MGLPTRKQMNGFRYKMLVLEPGLEDKRGFEVRGHIEWNASMLCAKAESKNTRVAIARLCARSGPEAGYPNTCVSSPESCYSVRLHNLYRGLPMIRSVSRRQWFRNVTAGMTGLL